PVRSCCCARYFCGSGEPDRKGSDYENARIPMQIELSATGLGSVRRLHKTTIHTTARTTGQESQYMKNNNEKKEEQNAAKSDLQRQRDYVQELKDKKFEFGLVLANTFVQSMREIGYKSTAFALNEHIDNAMQAGARNVHVAFGYGSG